MKSFDVLKQTIPKTQGFGLIECCHCLAWNNLKNTKCVKCKRNPKK